MQAIDMESLNDEFKRTVADMKPFAKQLPQKSDARHKITLWIKKLLGVKHERLERNEHAKLLLKQLKSGKLESPFVTEPPEGPLRMPYSASVNPLHLEQHDDPLESLFSTALSPLDSSPPLSSQEQHNLPGERSYHSLQSLSPELKPSELSYSSRVRLPKSRSDGFDRKKLYYPSKQKSKVTFDVPGRSPGTIIDTSHDPLARVQMSKRHPDSFFSPTKHTFVQTNIPTVIGSTSDTPHLSPVGYVWNSPSGVQSRTSSEGMQRRRKDKESSTGNNSKELQKHELDLSPLSVSEDFQPGSSVGDLLEDPSNLSDMTDLLQSSPMSGMNEVSVPAKSRGVPVLSTISAYPFTSPQSQPVFLSPKKLDISREILQAREVELKVRSAETKFQEEKLKLQRGHEEALKQILDRKNNEMEDMRSEHRIKAHKLETQNERLERKLLQIEQDCKHLQEQRDSQLSDSQHTIHQLRRQLQTEFDKKLHAAITDFERDKLELEQHHSKQTQHLLQETNTRIARANDEHRSKNRANLEVITELEDRVDELNEETENLTQAHSRITQEKAVVEQRCALLESELNAAQEKVCSVEEELSAVKEEKERQLKQVRIKVEQSAQSLQHQHNIQEAKMAEQISQFEYSLSQRQQQLEDMKNSQQRQTSELEMKHHQALREQELHYERKVIALQTEVKQRESQTNEEQFKLQAVLKEREQQLVQIRTMYELQSQQAEKAIEDFKSQVEKQTGSMFERMRSELNHMEKELTHCKKLREQQATEFSQKLQEENRKTGEKFTNLAKRHEQEVTQVKREHKIEVDIVRKEMEKRRESDVAKLSSSLAECEAQAKAKVAHSTLVISSLENENRDLKQQLEEQHCTYDKRISELKFSAEEEIRAKARIHEAAISKIKAQLGSQRTMLREEQKVEIASLQENHSHRLQQLEHDFKLKEVNNIEVVRGLETQLHLLQEDSKRQQCSNERQVSDLLARNEEEKASLKQHHETIRQSLQQDADATHSTVTQLEERIRRLQINNESKLSQLKLQFESRMKGMLPLTIQQEYEDTISSLRTQVRILSERTTILQGELDQVCPCPHPQ